MTWVVFALLGVAAVAVGKSIALYQEEKQDTAADSETPSDSVTTCLKEPQMCTMEYRPKTCTVEVQGKSHRASGSNGCQANQELLRALCAAGITRLDTKVFKSIRCQDAETHP